MKIAKPTPVEAEWLAKTGLPGLANFEVPDQELADQLRIVRQQHGTRRAMHPPPAPEEVLKARALARVAYRHYGRKKLADQAPHPYLISLNRRLNWAIAIIVVLFVLLVIAVGTGHAQTSKANAGPATRANLWFWNGSAYVPVETGSPFPITCVSGCVAGGSFTDNSAFTGAVSAVSPIGALYDTTPPAITDGNAGIPRMDSNRYLFTNCIVGCSGGASTPADAFANPTTAGLAMSFGMIWNGATWDRMQGDASKFLKVNCSAGCSAGSTTPADAFANPTTAGLSFAFNAGYNGATWDLLRSGDKNNVAGVVGVLNTGPLGRYNATQPTLTDTRYNMLQLSQRGELFIAKGVSGLSIDNTTFAATQSGTWSDRMQDGSGNALVSVATQADATANATRGLYVTSFGMTFNSAGGSWDRMIGVNQTLNSAGSGLLAAGLAGQFDDVAPTAVTENQFGNLRVSTNRNLYGTIRDAAGNERGANVDANSNLGVVLPAETTKVLGTTRTVGNVGGVLDAIGQNVATPANWWSVGCTFFTAPTTLTDSKGSPLTCTAAGALRHDVTSWLGSTAPSVGQKTMANSIPMVLASDQAAIPVTLTSTTITGTPAMNLTQVAATVLGATAVVNFGTAPAAVVVPAVNASIMSGTTALGTPNTFGATAPTGNALGANVSLFVATTLAINDGTAGALGMGGHFADNGVAAATNRLPTLDCIYQTGYANGTAATQGRNGAQSCGVDGLLWTAQLPALRPASFHSSASFVGSSTTIASHLIGHATNMVLVTKIMFSCTQTTAGFVTVTVNKTSAASSGGTAGNMTEVPDDSSYSAASASAESFTGTGPTVGTLVGQVDAYKLGCNAAATAGPNDIYILNLRQKPISLRSTSQTLEIGVGAATTGGNYTVTWEWEEMPIITP